jgi:hypothetical protein
MTTKSILIVGIALYNLIILPILLILNTESINIDSLTLYKLSQTVHDGEIRFQNYPPLYPALISNYSYFLGIEFTHIIGILLASLFLILMFIYFYITKMTNSGITFLLLFNSLPNNLFNELYYRTYTFQMTIFYFFIITFAFKHFVEKNKVNIKLYLFMTIVFSLISPLTTPFVMIGMTMAYFLSCERKRIVEFFYLTLLIPLLSFMGVITVFYYKFKNINQFTRYLQEIFNVYMNVEESNPLLDFVSLKSPHTLDLTLIFNKFLLVGVLFVVLIPIIFRSFLELIFNKFLFYLSLYFIFVSYTGIFEFSVVSGRSQWYFVFTLLLLLACLFHHIITKMNVSSKCLNKIYTSIFVINLVSQIHFPIIIT